MSFPILNRTDETVEEIDSEEDDDGPDDDDSDEENEADVEEAMGQEGRVN